MRSFWQYLFSARKNLGRKAPKQSRAPFRPRLEALEDRLVPANLAITDFRLVGEYHADLTPITATPEGAMSRVRLTYQTQALATSAKYVLRFTLDNNQTWTSSVQTAGAGQGGVVTVAPYSIRLWRLAAGNHTITVQLDGNNQVAETSEADNTRIIKFSTGGTFQSAYFGETAFITPLGGTPNTDWFINNYVDNNPNYNSGNLRTNYDDYRGGEYSYDGHEGIDYSLAGFAIQDAGLPVYAAASGTVVEVHDGEFDRSTTQNNLAYGNYIVIDHGNGWQTLYGHLRRNSVSVQVGDVMRAGDTIALVGSSGNSTGAHLHFNVLYKGLFVDPDSVQRLNRVTLRYYSPYWVTNLPYSGDVFGVLDSGITDHDVKQELNVSGEQPAEQTIFRSGQQVTFWAKVHGQKTTDSFQFFQTKPNGQVSSLAAAFTAGSRYAWMYRNFVPTNGLNPVGWWKVDLRRNGTVIASKSFYVTPSTWVNNGAFQFSAPQYTISEKGGQAIITVIRSASDGNATVQYSMVADTAQAGSDFTPLAGTLSFAPGVRQQAFSVPILNDSLHSGIEKLRLVLSNPTGGATLGTRTQADLVIVDDDALLHFNGTHLTVTADTEQVNDVITFDRQGDILVVTVNGEQRLFPALRANGTTIGVGAGDDTVNVETLLTETNVFLGAGNDVVNVSPVAKNLDNFLDGSTLLVVGDEGDDRLNVFDQAAVSADQENPRPIDYTLMDWGVRRENTWIYQDAFGPLVFTHETVIDINGGFEHVVLNTSPSGNTFVVEGVVTETAINGGGTDTLDYTPYQGPVSVNLTDGTATGLDGGVHGVANVIGSAFDDFIVGDGAANNLRGAAGNDILIGLDGADQLSGDDGRDLAIGGPGADVVNGGADEDILVAGSTAHDNDPVALAALMSEWTRADLPYADRVEHLLNGGGLNDPFLLNLDTFSPDGVPNTLTGAVGLDLFYGSRARDNHDWDPNLGEVFVDPDAVQFAIQIDGTALAGTYLFVDYATHELAAPFSVDLKPGQHSLYTYGGATLYFTVAEDGTIAYDPALEGILSGQGTKALKVNGVAVSVDARALGGTYLFLDYSTYELAAPINVWVLPGSHFFYTYGGATTWFTVAVDGTVGYDPALEGMLTGQGTDTLVVQGAMVQIDAGALVGTNLFLDYSTYDADAPINVRLLPGSHFFYTYGGATVWFNVAQDGTVDYDPALEGVLSGKGTNNLVINGATVQIDASALSASYLFLDYSTFDSTAPFTAQLLPGSHFFYTYGGATVWFSVAQDGTVDYDPALEGVLTGKGTGVLAVNGVAVQVDASALSGSYLFLDYSTYDSTALINVRLLPGSHFFYTYGGATVWFNVGADGTVDYDPAQDGFLSGRGTDKLIVNGWAISIDATAIASGFVALDYTGFDSTLPFQTRLLPGSHFIYTYGSEFYWFTVNADGTIDYDPALEGILSGKGTTSLVFSPPQ